ncbi:MAG TPA: MoxR family ATPase [Candidatus Lustribacter sp.]
MVPNAVADLIAKLLIAGYVADAPLATAMVLAQTIGRAVLLEGEPGVGKSEAARAYAAATGATFLRLQCYEGIDVAQAVYDWNYAKQTLAVRADADRASVPDLFSEAFLLRRPLLQALDASGTAPVVLLIDEIDRSDDEFEAFLLEFLQDFAITIPELGTLRAARRPTVFLTSNRTRELHDALKRRCLYHWLGTPNPEHERRILRLHLPAASDALIDSVVLAVERLRALDLRKRPGTAESIDWAKCIASLGGSAVDEATFDATIGAVVKHADDIATVAEHRSDLVA